MWKQASEISLSRYPSAFDEAARYNMSSELNLIPVRTITPENGMK